MASASPGAIGGFGANHLLPQSLVFLDVPALPQPDIYIGNVDKLLASDGTLQNGGTREFLHGFLDAFADWIRHHAHATSAAGA